VQDHHGENGLAYRCYVSLDIWLKENNLRCNNECTEKTALEEWGGVYVTFSELLVHKVGRFEDML
jgi:hypothetical protein